MSRKRTSFCGFSFNFAVETRRTTIKAKDMKQIDFSDGNMVFPLGEQGSEEIFTGKAWVCVLMKPTDSMQYLVAEVKYSASARTFWHTHPAEQVLLCTDGEGYYQERGKEARLLKKGDTVVIPPYVEHWHGAVSDCRFAHVAITNYKDGINVTWMEAVTEDEYDKANV